MTSSTRTALPPGQRELDHFPRFGTHLHRPPPDVPVAPAIEVAGDVSASFVVPLTDLAALPRREQTSDLHCVAGWSATHLRWEGVPFAAFYRARIEPALPTGTTVTHLSFAGLDGYASVVTLEDALADDVLLAERLDGQPLDLDHGAPVRLVSPAQYGFMSTKHLCRIEVHTREPRGVRAAHPFSRLMLHGPLVKRHPRARVWEEERHPYLPARLLRPLYHLVIRPGAWLSRGR